MSIIAALRAAGLSAEQIVTALEHMENEKISARREQNRINKRNQRSRQRMNADNADNADAADRDDLSGSFFLSSSSKNSEIKKEKEERKKDSRARKTLLPDDWEPKAQHLAKADSATVGRKADDMRNWAKSKAVMRADWDATFHGFLNRERKGQRNGAGNGVMEAFDYAIDRAGGNDIEGNPPMVDVTPRRT